MKISKNFIMKEVAGNMIVVPVGSEAINFNAIIHLNGIGAFIFEELQKEDLTIDELTDKICENYEVERPIAFADAQAFCAKLKENNILAK